MRKIEIYLKTLKICNPTHRFYTIYSSNTVPLNIFVITFDAYASSVAAILNVSVNSAFSILTT